MGRLMSANVARGGFEVRSYDIKGSGSCRSAREAAEGADVLITMLPDGDAVRDAVLEALPSLKRGAVVIDLVYRLDGPTRLLREAAARGAVAIDGREVLVDQARGQFRMMTGRELPLRLARQVAGLEAGP